jgi:uncharacterized protein YjbI with pentapeptide repeats
LIDEHPLFVATLLASLGGLLFWLLLWKLPQRQVRYVFDVKDRVDLESKARQTMAQIVGGAAILGGLYFTEQTLRTSQDTLQVNQKTLETTQQGQITERFTKAIEQLGNDNLAIRLGGIYALERIARDSAYDHWAVMEVLTAYVRENAPWPLKPPKPLKDMQQQQGDPVSKGEPLAAQDQQRPQQQKRGTFNGSVSSIRAQQIAEDFILSHDATIKAISWPGSVIDVDPSSVPSSIEFIVRFFHDEGVPPLQPLQLNHRPMLLPFFETTITATVSYSGLSGFADPGHPDSAQIFLLNSSGNLATPVPLQGGQVYWISLLETLSSPLVHWFSGESGPSVFRPGGGGGGDGSAWYENIDGANLGFAFTLFDRLIEQKGDPLSKREPPKGAPPAAQSRLLPKLPKQGTDIQAILTVLGRRTRTYETREDQVLDLRETDLRLADLAGAHLEKANLDRAHLERAQLPKASLERAHLWRASLERANLHGASLERANLVEAHLEVANLVEARLEGADLGGAQLNGATLVRAHLERTDLREAQMEQAFLVEAHLEGANLAGAQLEEAILVGAHLEGATLIGVQLKGADLRGAQLKGADLRRAQMKGAQSLTVEQLSLVKTMYQSQLDQSILEQIQRLKPQLLEKPQ